MRCFWCGHTNAAPCTACHVIGLCSDACASHAHHDEDCRGIAQATGPAGFDTDPHFLAFLAAERRYYREAPVAIAMCEDDATCPFVCEMQTKKRHVAFQVAVWAFTEFVEKGAFRPSLVEIADHMAARPGARAVILSRPRTLPQGAFPHDILFRGEAKTREVIVTFPLTEGYEAQEARRFGLDIETEEGRAEHRALLRDAGFTYLRSAARTNSAPSA